MKRFLFIQGISLRVILLFSVAIFGTFLSDYLSSINWFGDYYGDVYSAPELRINGLEQETELKWSARHCWYVWGIVLLFLLQLISLVWYIVVKVKEFK